MVEKAPRPGSPPTQFLEWEQLPTPYQEIDQSGRLLRVSGSWLERLGYPRGEVEGIGFGQFLAAGSQPAWAQILKDLFPSGAARGVELELVRKDGTHLSAAMEARSESPSPGSPPIARCFLVDIAQGEDLAFLRFLLEHSSEAMVLYDLQGKVVDASRQACDLLGYTREELLELWAADLEPDSEMGSFASKGKHLLDQGPEILPGRRRRKDGVLLPVEIRPHAFQLRGQEVILALVRELSEGAQAPAQARAVNEALQAVVEASPVCVMALDRERNVTLWNPAAERLFGWKRSEVLGRPNPIVPPEEADESRAIFARVLRGEPVAGVEVRRQRKDGAPVDLSLSTAPLRDAAGNVVGVMAIGVDISGRKRSEAALRESEARYRTLFEESPIALWEEDFSDVKTYLDRLQLAGIRNFRAYLEAHPEAGTHCLSLVKVLDLNKRALEFYQSNDKTVFLGRLDQVYDPSALDVFKEELIALAEGQTSFEREFPATRPSGERRLLGMRLTVAPGCEATLSRVLISFADTTEQHRAVSAVRDQTALSEALRDTAAVLTSTLNREEVLERVLGEIGRVVPHDAADIMLIEGGVARVVRSRGMRERMPRGDTGVLRLRVAETPNLQRQVQTGLPVVIADVQAYPGWKVAAGAEWIRSYVGAPIRVKGEIIGFIDGLSVTPGFYTQVHADRLQVFASQTAVALENARLYEEAQRRAEELAALAEVSASLRTAPSPGEMAPIILDKLMTLLQAQGTALGLRDPNSGETVVELARGLWSAATGVRLRPGESIIGRVIQTGQPLVTEDLATLTPYSWPSALSASTRALAVFPMSAQGMSVGALWAGGERGFTDTQIRILMAVSDMAANAIHRATLHEQTEQRLRRLTALHSIEMAISATTDLRVCLDILLNQVTTQLGVSAADVLLLDPHSQMLEYAAGNGFRSSAIMKTRVRLGEGLAGRAAFERSLVSVSDLAARSGPADAVDRFTRAALLVGEGFQAFFAVPLISKGQVGGVLEIFHRARLEPDPEWMDFLQTLAGQAALALDNATLFDRLQRTNIDLMLAYDATLEGWSKALDLKDQETEGHTQRVTEMTMRLARAVGVGESQLEQIRRGALIHDIGKMGIPDSILLKPGPLSEEEWVIMRKHPTYAYDLLSPIAFLRQALDIPYAHHERWDGSGYPRGLRGEQIPLAARVFAVIDVYDALCSDRPYRRAWPESKAREYIREQAGRLFDPKAVAAFLETKL